MKFDDLLNQVFLELSGERARRLTGILSNYHRIQASSGLLNAINVIKKELVSLGDIQCKIKEYKADGKKHYYDWNTPIPWEITKGKLTLIKPKKKILCDFSRIPETIATHSKATDVITTIVDIEDGSMEDIKNSDVKGKIVLTTGAPRNMISKLHEAGALGVVGYPDEERAARFPEMIRYLGIWPNADNIDISTFGFSISRTEAGELKDYLKEGKEVQVHAKIDATLKPGKLHLLTTKLKGKKDPEKEIILIAHICHPSPSANDNASGSALLLEIYKTIKQLIDERIIELDFSIRFIWTPEFSGTLAWIKEQKERDSWKPIFCINLDMVGEHPGLVGYPFTVFATSITTPTYLDDLIEYIIDKIKDTNKAIEQSGWSFPWNYRIKPHSGGSDHVIFNDEPTRTPSVMFGHNDTFHHTNLDTIEKVDPTTLKRVGVLTTTLAVICAHQEEFGEEIIISYTRGFQNRKANFYELLLDLNRKLSKKESNNTWFISQKLVKDLRDFFIANEKKCLQEITSNTGIHDNLTKLIEEEIMVKENNLNLLLDMVSFKNREEIDKYFLKIPMRKWEGPINPEYIYKIVNEEKGFLKSLQFDSDEIKILKTFLKDSKQNYGGILHEFINLINGKNTIYDIYVKISFVKWELLSIEKINLFLQYLESLELVNLEI